MDSHDYHEQNIYKRNEDLLRVYPIHKYYAFIAGFIKYESTNYPKWEMRAKFHFSYLRHSHTYKYISLYKLNDLIRSRSQRRRFENKYTSVRRLYILMKIAPLSRNSVGQNLRQIANILDFCAVCALLPHKISIKVRILKLADYDFGVRLGRMCQFIYVTIRALRCVLKYITLNLGWWPWGTNVSFDVGGHHCIYF